MEQSKADPALTLEEVREIAQSFVLEGSMEEIGPYGGGHINDTFLVTTTKKRYILQRISRLLTEDAVGLMENIVMVTEHLRKRTQDPRGVLTVLPTREGENALLLPSGNWRVYEFIENSLCLGAPAGDDLFYKSALAFGNFMELLGDFPAEKLHDTIPDFHNTPKRFSQFHAAIREDRAGRLREVEEEVEFLLSREEEAGQLMGLLERGELPLRVTHNDTKLDNILFDKDTLEPLCIIDLDTVMGGLSLYDFGDGIRSGAATAPEDEKDLSKVHLDVRRYHLYQKGYTKACPTLTPLERELLPLGAKTITVEQGVRFLADYLNGDVYYHVAYGDHNLVRCRTQLRLIREMEEHWDELLNG